MHEAFAIIQGMLMTLLEFEEFMYCKYCFVFHDMQNIFWPKIGVKDSTCTSFIPKSLAFILLSNALFFFQTNNVFDMFYFICVLIATSYYRLVP